jgi:DNA-binding IclR family transcriptional regulator
MATERIPKGPAQGIKSIEVGSRVLVALEQGRGPMPLSEVAAASGMHPAKVHRYLVSLVRVGLASQSADTGLYDLGPESRALGVEALRRTDAVSIVSSHAVALRDDTGHTVNVAVWSDAGPALVRWDTGAHALPIVVRVGSTLPLLDSAVGVVFFAYLPLSVTTPVLKAQQKDGATRAMSTRDARELAATVRRDGLGRTKNHMILGLAALAAPVFGADGALELVIGLVLPTRLMTAKESRRLGRLLGATAREACKELGFNPS